MAASHGDRQVHQSPPPSACGKHVGEDQRAPEPTNETDSGSHAANMPMTRVQLAEAPCPAAIRAALPRTCAPDMRQHMQLHVLNAGHAVAQRCAHWAVGLMSHDDSDDNGDEVAFLLAAATAGVPLLHTKAFYTLHYALGM